MNRLFFRVSVMALIFASPLFARIINIPADYQSIQAGINASTNGDTVLAQQGIYLENINFNGHSITLGSQYLVTGDTSFINTTIINGNRAGSVITLNRGENELNKIIGLTITNGYAVYGGGIYCDSSDCTIRKCLITENQAFQVIPNPRIPYGYGGQGGAIYYKNNSSVVIESTSISGNISTANYYQCGTIQGLQAVIRCQANDISSNTGAGIIIDGGGEQTIIDNIVEANSGSAIIVNSIHSHIEQNQILENGYGINIIGAGGGVTITNSTGIIRENVIAKNHYAGITCDAVSAINIINNIVTETHGGEFSRGGIICPSPTQVIKNTICWSNYPAEIVGNPTVTYSDIRGGWPGQGNMNSDPNFIDPATDTYNICSQSPCINAGDPSIIDPDSTISDIGVYFSTHPECTIGIAIHVSTTGNDSSGNGSIFNPFKTVQFAIDKAHNGDTVLIHQGLFHQNINLTAKSIILGSYYLLTNDSLDILNTIIDGDSLAPAINLTICDSSTKIIGLTIMHGLGYGIYSSDYGPSIRLNLITDNYGSGIGCNFSNARIVSNKIFGNVSLSMGGGIYCRYSDAIIDSNIIEDNIAIDHGGGIACYDASPIIRNNQILMDSAGSYGGGIYLAYGRATVDRNIVSHNRSANGAGIWGSLCSPTVSNNYITDNIASSNGGGMCFRDNYHPIVDVDSIKVNSDRDNKADSVGVITDNTDPFIFGNTISNNYATNGGGIYGGVNGTIKNNLIIGNSASMFGGGQAFGYSNPTIINNIYYANTAENGGGLYCSYTAPTFTNCIIRENIHGQITHIGLTPIINYCNVQGEGYSQPGNIDINPCFRNVGQYDFHLMSLLCGDSINSPCIDAGDPSILDSLIDCQRGLGTNRSDMGAYGGRDSISTSVDGNETPIPTEFYLSQNYPNPFNSSTVLRYTTPTQSPVTIAIYDILGRKVQTLVNSTQPAGEHQVIWNANDIPSGVYFYKLTTGGQTQTKKMVMIR